MELSPRAVKFWPPCRIPENRVYCRLIPSTLSRTLSLERPRQSLRTRLLWPLVAASILTSIAIALGSYGFASRTAENDLNARYRSIVLALESSSFPLTRNVLQSVASLTESELIAIRFDDAVIHSTLSGNGVSQLATNATRLKEKTSDPEMFQIQFEGVAYRAAVFQRTQIAKSNETPSRIIVLFDESKITATLARAVIAPLATGLSTLVLLTTVTLLLTTRLVRRLSRLQNQVERIAEGEFATELVPGPPDEVGRLATAVDSMATQLQQMWNTLHQREGERLLHQVAAGLAHNLRNSLTGARMAIELHATDCHRDDEGLKIALHEIEQTENYVKRLLDVAAGRQGTNKPAKVIDCIQDVQASLNATANHMGVPLNWRIAPTCDGLTVQDGPSLVAAMTNLVFNAIQCGREVSISASSIAPHRVTIDVTDDGPGPAPELKDTIFEPFVTTKPEGLGLGLPLVRRAAQRLGGDVTWARHDSLTTFTLVVNAE